MKIMRLSVNILLVMLMIIGLTFVIAAPEKPNAATVQSTSRHNTSGVYNTSDFGAFAEAGNITYINLTAPMATQTWAAYYGNITGTMSLDNVGGSSVYSWTLANPGGKVFATESVVADWSAVYCWNWSKATSNGLHWSEWNLNFTVDPIDPDSVNATFSGNYDYSTFTLTGRTFSNSAGTEDNDATTCPGVELFNNTGVASGNNQYEEVILGILPVSSTLDTMTYDELIYMATIEPNGLGFDGSQIDFQMILPQDGHGTGDNNVADYYFYVELDAS